MRTSKNSLIVLLPDPFAIGDAIMKLSTMHTASNIIRPLQELFERPIF